MPGALDPLYVQARRVLLDATDALAEQLDAIVLVGAQAIYLHTGDADLAVAEYTTDADFSISPADLTDSPLLAELMTTGGFVPDQHPGAWLSPDGITVDLMVPDALAGPGSRGARLGTHGKRVARRAKGLERALVDRDRMTIAALDPNDDRSVSMLVAGPAALLVAKTHKIAERAGDTSRIRDKDALDVLRILQTTSTSELSRRLELMKRDGVSTDVAEEAMAQLGLLFGSLDAIGVEMAVRAAGPEADPQTIAASLTLLVVEIIDSDR
jgi:hypothetical protein